MFPAGGKLAPFVGRRSVSPGFAMMVSGLAFKATMVGGFPLLSVFGYVMTWGGAVHVVTWPVIQRAKRLLIKVARWASR
jgi:hypothetical protein